MNNARQVAHELIDRLPEAQVSRLVRYLEEMMDPASAALASAPLDDEPETEEERRKVEESRRWLESRQGRGIPHEEAMRQLGLD